MSTSKRTIGVVVLSGVLLSVGFLSLQSFKSSDKTEATKRKIEDSSTFHSIPHVPKTASFAGESVPLQYLDVKERFEREIFINSFWHTNTFILMKRITRYFPIIEPILKAEGVPDDFKYLAVIESGLTQAVSPAKAVGFWQILSSTGRELGLEVNSIVDERYHIEKSTYAACKFIKKSYDKYGSWTMAAATYNRGRKGINDQIKRQKVDNYYDLLLGEETERYVFRIVAAKIFFSNTEAYGFKLPADQLYKPVVVDTVVVSGAVPNFADFAIKHGISYKTLKIFNPWLRDNHLPNSTKKSYEILIPKEGYKRMTKLKETEVKPAV